MKASYEERLAVDFGLRRRCDEGNDAVLSVRAGGNADQLFCSETLTSVDRSYDNNRLLNDGTHTYTYDFEGNRTKKTVTATGEATEYEWDHRNRLARVTHLDSIGDPIQTLDYAYDVLDRRIEKSDTPAVGPAYTERYVYDGEHLALKFGASALANRYLHGPVIDQILADEQVSSLSSPGDVLWPLVDNMGTVRDLAEYDSGTGDTVIVNHISYDAYGGSRTETNAAVDHLFGYTGREWDAEADLQYNRARWYDPAVGRWLSEDPIGFEAGDANLSRYVGNEPTMRIDPSGLEETGPTFGHLFNPFMWGDYARGARLQSERETQVREANLRNPDLFEQIAGVQRQNEVNRRLAVQNASQLATLDIQVYGVVTGMAAAGGVNNAARNAANFARYKDELRAAMSKPYVSDVELARYMDQLYREGAQIGSGSTAAAVRHELATGGTVGGVTHSQKARDMITALQRWLKNNPTAPSGDRAAAENVIRDMLNALNGN